MSANQGTPAATPTGLAIPRSFRRTTNFSTFATSPTFDTTLFGSTTITTLLASSYIDIRFSCACLHTGAFTGNSAPTVRIRLNGGIIGGCTVNMTRNLIMPLVFTDRAVVSAGVQTVVVEISKFAGGANALQISALGLRELVHATLRLAEEF